MRIADFKLSYRADEALLDTSTRKLWMALLMLALAAYPLVAGDYLVYMGCLLGINVIAAIGLNVLVGNTGQLSVGHAAFMAVGAYTVVLSAKHLGLPFWLALPLAGAVSAGVGAVVGLPSLRIKGLYLAMATLASQFLIVFVISHWSVLGGGRGLAVEPASLGPWRLDNDRKVYFLIVGCAFGLALFAWNLFRTRIGRAFIAVRERDYSAEVLGVNLLRYKLLAFALSSFYAGVAGGLLAYFFKFVGPEHFGFSVSVFFLAAVIIGGLGSVLGAVLGTLFMTLVPELLKELVGLLAVHYPGQAQRVLAPAREFVFGLLIVLFLLFEPGGLAQIWRRIREAARTWPFKN